MLASSTSPMLAAALRTTRPATRSFIPPNRGLAKLTLVGYLGADPEIRTTKTDREYVSYVVGTKNNPPPPAPDGTRQEPTTSWHRIFAFQPSQVQYLSTLRKGSLVYAEADYETRDSSPDAAPGSVESHRQALLRHDKLKVLKRPPREVEE